MKYFVSKLMPPRESFLVDMTDAERKLMQEHGMYLRTFHEKGYTVIFGPVADPKGSYGLGIWEVPDDFDLAAVNANDPVIKSGLGFRYEVAPMLQAVVRT